MQPYLRLQLWSVGKIPWTLQMNCSMARTMNIGVLLLDVTDVVFVYGQDHDSLSPTGAGVQLPRVKNVVKCTWWTRCLNVTLWDVLLASFGYDRNHDFVSPCWRRQAWCRPVEAELLILFGRHYTKVKRTLTPRNSYQCNESLFHHL